METETVTKSRKERSKKTINFVAINIMALIFFGFVMFMVGFGSGQASVYKKQHDTVSIEDVYNAK